MGGHLKTAGIVPVNVYIMYHDHRFHFQKRRVGDYKNKYSIYFFELLNNSLRIHTLFLSICMKPKQCHY